MCQSSSPTSPCVIHPGELAQMLNAIPYVVRSVDVGSGCPDSEGWPRNLTSVWAPFVSLLAPLSGTANLTTRLADKQLIEYGTAGDGLVYIVSLNDGLTSYFLEAEFRIITDILDLSHRSDKLVKVSVTVKGHLGSWCHPFIPFWYLVILWS